jgi:capsular polysaccharide biosynthesis protein
VQPDGGDYIFSVRYFVKVIQQQLWLILLIACVVTGIVLGFSFMQTPMYQASIKILVAQKQGSGNLGSDVQGLQQLTRTVVEGLNSLPTAEAVIQKQDLQMSPDTVLSNLNAKQIPETQYVEVDYTDSSAQRAQLIANTIGDVASEQISDLSPSPDAITATVWQRAQLPIKPAKPNIVFNGGFGLLIGLLLGVVVAYLLEHRDHSWRTWEEAEQTTGRAARGGRDRPATAPPRSSG